MAILALGTCNVTHLIDGNFFNREMCPLRIASNFKNRKCVCFFSAHFIIHIDWFDRKSIMDIGCVLAHVLALIYRWIYQMLIGWFMVTIDSHENTSCTHTHAHKSTVQATGWERKPIRYWCWCDMHKFMHSPGLVSLSILRKHRWDLNH